MKFLVIDDHGLIRDSLRILLREIRDDATVLEAARFDQAMRLLSEHPDVVMALLDLGLPDRDGFDALADLRRAHPSLMVVILSATDDRESVIKALDLGAVGFMPKSGQREVMLGGLRLVLAGGLYIPPEILARSEPRRITGGNAAGFNERAPSPADLGLSSRQLEVLALMMLGKSNKSICRALNLAEPTVKYHVTTILRSLEVGNRTEAVLRVGVLGWALPAVEQS